MMPHSIYLKFHCWVPGDPLAVAKEHMWPEFGDTRQAQGTDLCSRSAAVTGARASGLSTEVKDCLDMKAESPPC